VRPLDNVRSDFLALFESVKALKSLQESRYPNENRQKFLVIGLGFRKPFERPALSQTISTSYKITIFRGRTRTSHAVCRHQTTGLGHNPAQNRARFLIISTERVGRMFDISYHLEVEPNRGSENMHEHPVKSDFSADALCLPVCAAWLGGGS